MKRYDPRPVLLELIGEAFRYHYDCLKAIAKIVEDTDAHSFVREASGARVFIRSVGGIRAGVGEPAFQI